MRILITGAQIANKGAQSMLLTVMDQFRRRYSDVESNYITLVTRRFTALDDLSATPGSRYLTISHESAARYMIAHPDERIALVATPCAIQALCNTIELHHLDRERYLLTGLFCARTMHYGVAGYFSRHPRGKGRELRGLRFRTKRIAGWPGDLQREYADGSQLNLPYIERMRVKEYFMPERFLYCMDKLKRESDIAIGDNYIPANADELGANQAWSERGLLFRCAAGFIPESSRASA